MINTNMKRYSDSQRDVGDNLHILVFDLMYSGQVYGLYPYENFTRSKASKSSARNIKERQAEEYKEKTKELEDLKNQLAELQAKLDAIPEIVLDGECVYHKKFGTGKVAQTGSYIIVTFDNKEAKFALPGAVADGFLTIQDQEKTDNAILQRDYIKQAKMLSYRIREIEAWLE